MVNEEATTMDATRRMLLKQNKINYSEDTDLFPAEDFDALTLECILDSQEPELSEMESRKLRNGNPMKSLSIIPSILMRTKRRRQASNSWLLNSIHHPRLPLLTLSKFHSIKSKIFHELVYLIENLYHFVF